jgi:hypothetical protein
MPRHDGDHVSELTSLEICAGAGGQSLGLDQVEECEPAAVVL